MKILHPFSIDVHLDSDVFVSSSDICDVFEQGDTADDAAKNLLDSLEDELNWLTENESTLSPVIRERLAFLRQYIATD